MKKLLFLFLVLISLTSKSQPSIKLFAYSREVTAGTIPKGVTDEYGKPVNTKKETHVNYYIFAVQNPSAKINFTEIWINGKFYKTQTRKIDTTPVVNINENVPDNPVKEVLVPFTKLKVISIIPGITMNTSVWRRSWFREMTRNNELIVTYMYNGKKYFKGIKKIKVLEYEAGL